SSRLPQIVSQLHRPPAKRNPSLRRHTPQATAHSYSLRRVSAPAISLLIFWGRVHFGEGLAMSRRWITAVFALAVALGSRLDAAAFRQIQTGSILVHVADEQGGVLPG